MALLYPFTDVGIVSGHVAASPSADQEPGPAELARGARPGADGGPAAGYAQRELGGGYLRRRLQR